MTAISRDHAIYILTTEDIQTVCSEECSRNLTEEEVRKVEGKVGDYIDWYEVILAAIQDIAPDAIGEPEDSCAVEEE